MNAWRRGVRFMWSRLRATARTQAVAGGVMALAPWAAMAIAGAETAGLWTLHLTFYTAFVLALVTAAGGPGADLGSGAIHLWIQKPVSASRMYLLRRAAAALLVCGIVTVVLSAGAVQLRLLGDASGARRLLLGIPASLLATLCLLALVHAVSGMAVRREAFGAVLLLVALLLVALAPAMQPGVWGRAAPVLEILAFPADHLGAAGRFLRSSGEPGGGAAFARVSAFIGVWTGLGTAATAWTARSAPSSAAE